LNDRDEVPGYVVPVHRSLTEPLLLAGVPPKVAISLGMAAGILVGAWHIYLLLPVLVIAYLAAAAVSKRDPYALDIILQNRGQSRYLP
jgi:type IV secretory pathway TrbD component